MASLAFFGEPRTPRLSKLLEEVRQGEIRIPRFQRPFIWTDGQRLSLLESIYNGYPIGAILVWRTQKHQLITYERLGPLRLPEESEGMVTRQYLLDGHQRLATLFAALGPGLYGRSDEAQPTLALANDDEATRWPIYFDLRFDQETPDSTYTGDKRPFRLAQSNRRRPVTWLPLDILFDSYKLLEFADNLREKNFDRKLVNRVHFIADVFRDYTLPVMPIATEELSQATASFKRINSVGTPMSEVHMVNALTWSSKFDLLQELEDIAAELGAIGWKNFDQQMILNICKTRLDVALYEEEAEQIALKLKAAPDVLNMAKDDIVKVAEVLDKIAKVRGPAILPYSYQAVLLADALRDVHQPDNNLLDKLRIWFWATTLTEYFRGMTKALFERAREHLRALVQGTAPPLPPNLPAFVDPVGRFDFRSARSRAIALLLAEQRPHDPAGRPDDPFDLLAQYGSDALSKLFTENDVGRSERKLLEGPENRFLVHPKSTVVLRDLKTGTVPIQLQSRLSTHAVNASNLKILQRKQWGEFLRLRRSSIEKIERDRAEECELQYRTEE